MEVGGDEGGGEGGGNDGENGLSAHVEFISSLRGSVHFDEEPG